MDGWIEWFGETEVPPDTQGRMVEVRYRASPHALEFCKDLATLHWKHKENGGDIVAYRFVGSAPSKQKELKMPDKKLADVEALLIERGQRYGVFTRHAEVSQALKDILFVYKSRDAYRPDQVEALEMICHKLGRIANGDHDYFDSWKDIAGYAKLVSDRLEKGEEK